MWRARKMHLTLKKKKKKKAVKIFLKAGKSKRCKKKKTSSYYSTYRLGSGTEVKNFLMSFKNKVK